ncbi:hypothetical protein F5B19DRAFT_504642 [Rostrohypoxylon terebratum]|nr:hypothetical protein F5B19DRAFT_504642 [Rostrohypoxylon terebratum]
MSDYLEYFDFDAFPAADEYTLDFGDLDKSYPIGGGEWNFDPSATLPPPPDAPAALVESSFDAEAQCEFSLPRRVSHAGSSEVHGNGNPDDLAIELEQNANSESQKQDPSTPDHQRIQGTIPSSCVQCHESFQNNYQLENHVWRTEHKAYICSCGRDFLRLDALVRHQRSFRKDERQFPCTFRKCHRNKRGFTRRDHLSQHLQNYHKLDQKRLNGVLPPTKQFSNEYQCIDPTCEFNQGGKLGRLVWNERRDQAAFNRRSGYMKHLKEIHNVTPFPCPAPGCQRVGAKGFTSWSGIEKHLTREHKLATEDMKLENYVPKRSCDRCGQPLKDLGEFNLHRQFVCRDEEPTSSTTTFVFDEELSPTIA